MKLKTTLMLAGLLLFVLGLLVYAVARDPVSSRTVKYAYQDLFLAHEPVDLMLGSSSIEMLDTPVYLSCGDWLNRGIGNSRVSDINNYLALTFLPIKPPRILLYAGENDLSGGMSVDDTFAAYQRLVERLLQRYPDSEIHVLALKRSPARRGYWRQFEELNRVLQAFSGESDRVHFHAHNLESKGGGAPDFLKDGIHLTDAGYRSFTQEFNRTCRPG